MRKRIAGGVLAVTLAAGAAAPAIGIAVASSAPAASGQQQQIFYRTAPEQAPQTFFRT